MITLTLENDEAQALVGLLDLAVKSGGLQAATVAVAIFQKLQAAAAQPKEDTNP